MRGSMRKSNVVANIQIPVEKMYCLKCEFHFESNALSPCCPKCEVRSGVKYVRYMKGSKS